MVYLDWGFNLPKRTSKEHVTAIEVTAWTRNITRKYWYPTYLVVDQNIKIILLEQVNILVCVSLKYVCKTNLVSSYHILLDLISKIDQTVTMTSFYIISFPAACSFKLSTVHNNIMRFQTFI